MRGANRTNEAIHLILTKGGTQLFFTSHVTKSLESKQAGLLQTGIRITKETRIELWEGGGGDAGENFKKQKGGRRRQEGDRRYSHSTHTHTDTGRTHMV